MSINCIKNRILMEDFFVKEQWLTIIMGIIIMLL